MRMSLARYGDKLVSAGRVNKLSYRNLLHRDGCLSKHRGGCEKYQLHRFTESLKHNVLSIHCQKTHAGKPRSASQMRLFEENQEPRLGFRGIRCESDTVTGRLRP